jgi:hypothetical protein
MTHYTDPFENGQLVPNAEEDWADHAADDLTNQECADFQALMPKRIEAGEDLQSFPHMLTCERCRALVRDLEYIAEVARQLIPVEEEPRDELWAQIQLAIERGEA